jgi:hypothetical protein
MRDLVQTPERLYGLKSNVLFSFVVNGRACPLRRDVNERANFRWIKNHVTVFLGARLYQA